MNINTKAGLYQRIYTQLEKILAKSNDPIARMATVASVLHYKFSHFYWTGFYRYIDGNLLVGPYQGFVACQNLQKDTGVCWAVYNSKKTIIVPDVTEFPGHIACDKRSKSEIALPCINAAGDVFAVFDVDSDKTDSFDEIDKSYLEKITHLLSKEN